MPGAGFGQRFVVGMLEVYRANLQTFFGRLRFPQHFRASSGAPQHGLCTFTLTRFLEGECQVTHKSRTFPQESAHASGTIRKPATRSTR